MTTPRTPAAPRNSSTRSKGAVAKKVGPGAPGAKPTFLIVEHSFHAQLEEGGEVVLDLRLPFDNILAMTRMEVDEDSDDKANMKLVGYMVDEVIPEDVHAQLQSLRDGAEAFRILMAYVEAVSTRLGAGLGE